MALMQAVSPAHILWYMKHGINAVDMIDSKIDYKWYTFDQFPLMLVTGVEELVTHNVHSKYLQTATHVIAQRASFFLA